MARIAVKRGMASAGGGTSRPQEIPLEVQRNREFRHQVPRPRDARLHRKLAQRRLLAERRHVADELPEVLVLRQRRADSSRRRASSTSRSRAAFPPMTPAPISNSSADDSSRRRTSDNRRSAGRAEDVRREHDRPGDYRQEPRGPAEPAKLGLQCHGHFESRRCSRSSSDAFASKLMTNVTSNSRTVVSCSRRSLA